MQRSCADVSFPYKLKWTKSRGHLVNSLPALYNPQIMNNCRLCIRLKLFFPKWFFLQILRQYCLFLISPRTVSTCSALSCRCGTCGWPPAADQRPSCRPPAVPPAADQRPSCRPPAVPPAADQRPSCRPPAVTPAADQRPSCRPPAVPPAADQRP